MNPKVREMAKLLTIPLIFLLIYFSLWLIWKIFNLPSDDQLLIIVNNFFDKYGLWVVFIGALIEGFLLLGIYFPGGFIIFLGVISAGDDIGHVVEVVTIVSMAFFISYTFNYGLGKYGWYHLFVKFGLRESLDKAQEKIKDQGLNAVVLSYWQPSLASLTATAAGILNISFSKFLLYSVIGIIIWNTFWGTLVYHLGDAALQSIGVKYVIVIFIIWVSIILIRRHWKNKKGSPSDPVRQS